MWPFKKKQKREPDGVWMNYTITYEPPTVEEKLATLAEKVHLMENYLGIHLVDPPKGYKKCRKSR
jgi:hypothetical protein